MTPNMAEGASVMRSFGPFNDYLPSIFRTRLRWSRHWTTTITTSTTSYAFSANDAHDPGQASTSTQPIGFPQLAVLYNRYRVYRSEIMVRLCYGSTVANTAASGATTLVVLPSNGATSVATIEQALAMSGARFSQCVNAKPAVVNHAMSIGAFEGAQVATMKGSDRFQAQVTASPTEAEYWQIYAAASVAEASDSWTFEAVIVYDIEFFDRIPNNIALESFVDTRKRIDHELKEAKHNFARLLDQQKGDDTVHVDSGDTKLSAPVAGPARADPSDALSVSSAPPTPSFWRKNPIASASGDTAQLKGVLRPPVR